MNSDPFRNSGIYGIHFRRQEVKFWEIFGSFWGDRHVVWDLDGRVWDLIDTFWGSWDVLLGFRWQIWGFMRYIFGIQGMHFWDAGRVFCLFPGGAGEGRDWSAERGPRIQSSPQQGSGGAGSYIHPCVGCQSSADAKKMQEDWCYSKQKNYPIHCSPWQPSTFYPSSRG